MAGTRRNKKQVIEDKIQKIDEKIALTEEKIKDMKTEKENLIAELAAINEAENKAAEEAEMKELIKLIKTKNISVDEIKTILENKSE